MGTNNKEGGKLWKRFSASPWGLTSPRSPTRPRGQPATLLFGRGRLQGDQANVQGAGEITHQPRQSRSCRWSQAGMEKHRASYPTCRKSHAVESHAVESSQPSSLQERERERETMSRRREYKILRSLVWGTVNWAQFTCFGGNKLYWHSSIVTVLEKS